MSRARRRVNVEGKRGIGLIDGRVEGFFGFAGGGGGLD